MIGRLYNKERKRREFAREHAAKIRPVDMSLIDKSLRYRWNTDEPIADTRMIICECGHKKRFHIALGMTVGFECTKCGRVQVVKLR